MRTLLLLLRASIPVVLGLAASCGGKSVAGRSDFPAESDPGYENATGSCFCASDSGISARREGGSGIDSAVETDAPAALCPSEAPKPGATCPDYRFAHCTYLIPHGVEGGTCHLRCDCQVTPEAESWFCGADLDCDP